MKKFISVIFWMRAISCLGVVLTHSISITLGQNPNLEKNEENINYDSDIEIRKMSYND
ncbi:hypothetical protein AABD34_01455 [Staphylococcus saprophyticus]|uniref:hypothetical protein n=1 Tax=Staphylococcus saprophyticus TaxID=29385 RepID=UPI00398AA380